MIPKAPMTAAPVITVDGPSGVGKGTAGDALARKLGFHFLDSGAWYRILAWEHPLEPLEALPGVWSRRVQQLAPVFDAVDTGGWRLWCRDVEITHAIRTSACGQRASRLAVIPEVREALCERFRMCQKVPGLVADGRDMGTVVFPNAVCKFYLTAPVQTRAYRRWAQLKKQGIDANLNALVGDVCQRDARDASRDVAPLAPACDAVIMDTAAHSASDVLRLMWKCVQSGLQQAGSPDR